jgi:hypothetical protein
MTTEPNDEQARPGSGQDHLRDGDMPAPYPDDTPGGVQEGADPDGDGADLEAEAERIADESN